MPSLHTESPRYRTYGTYVVVESRFTSASLVMNHTLKYLSVGLE